MVMLMIATGAVFALLFIVNNLLRAGREKVGFLDTLLGFLALILPLLALVNNNASERPLALVNTAAIGIAVVVILASVVTLLVERRKPELKLNQRRGLLGIGVGVLLIAATFVAPLAPTLLAPPPIALSASVPNTNVSATAEPESTEVAFAPTSNAAILQLSATPTRLPSATPTPTNTPYVLVSPTPGAPEADSGEADAPQTVICSALVNWNLNLRSGPGLDTSRLLTIPFNTSLSLTARDEAATWWYTTYQNESGWVSGEYITLTGECTDLPVREQE
jgi:hypothetical protein